MTEINIKIPKEDERRELWHFPPIDENPEAPGITTFRFFDGWTVPLDLEAEYVDASTFTIQGEYTNRFLLEDPIVIKYINDDDDEVTMPASVLIDSTYSRSDGKTTVTVSEVPDTIVEVRVWIDCPDLSGPLVEVFSDSKEFNGAEFVAVPIITGIRCFSNESSKVPISTIEREYTEDNPDRWERKPLGVIPGSPSDGIWPLGEGGFFDVLLELKREEEDDNTKRGDATSISEDEEDFKEKGSYEYLQYVSRRNSAGKTAIAVSECGSGSKGHYFSEVWKDTGEKDANGHPVYTPNNPANAEDRLIFNEKHSGIFYIPFDTSDTTNYKVTEEPDFEADEVDGSFISANKQYDIMLFPRRWGYYCRTEELWPSGSLTYAGERADGACGYSLFISFGGDIAQDNIGNPNPPIIWPNDAATYTRNQKKWEMDVGPRHLTYYSEMDDFNVTDWEWNLGGTIKQYCARWFDPTGHDGELIFGPYCYTHPDPWNPSYEATVTVCTQEHRVGLWWDRWPNGLRIPTGGGISWYPIYYSEIDQLPHYYYAGKADNDETLEVVQDYDDKSLSGHNTIDHLSGEGWGIIYGFGFESRANSCSASMQSCGPNMKLTPGVTGDPYYPLNRIWNKIAGVTTDPTDITTMQNVDMTEATIWIPTVDSSEFWTKHGLPAYNPDRPYSMWDNIPYGVSVSPCKMGELCGIVKVRDKEVTRFIWRKTDEEVDLEVTSVLNEYKGHKASFESFAPEHPKDGSLSTQIPNIIGWSNSGVEISGDVGQSFGQTNYGTFIDQFGGGKLRLRDKIGRNMINARDDFQESAYTICEEEWARGYIGWGTCGEEDCQIDLDVPIAIMLTKERAIRWSRYPGADWSLPWTNLIDPLEQLRESRVPKIAQEPSTYWRNEEKDFRHLGWA